MADKVVIIGGGAAGIDVLDLLLRGCGDTDGMHITLLKKEKEGFFSMCGLPYALQGVYDMDTLTIFGPDFYEDKGVDFRTGAEAISIDLEGQHVRLDSGEEIPYDHLVIATGSKPNIPPIEGANLEGVFTLCSKEDGVRVEAAIDTDKVKDALVVGGGWIGLQAAVAFSQRGIKTRVVEMLPHLIPALLDPDMASLVKKWLEEDITFILGRSVDAIKGRERVESVMVGGEELPADIVMISAGMRPNVDIAKNAGIDLGVTGGISTDCAFRVRRGRSYLDNVYALGDCVEVLDAITHAPRLSQLASTALIQARVVANNLLGTGSTYDLCLGPAVAVLAGLQVGSVGVTTEVAERYGIQVRSGRAAKYTKARFFPGKKMIIAKLIFEAYARKLIGAQIVSEETVAERINELALGIRAGITAREIWMRERCFDPSLAMVEDVIVDAALKAGG